MADDISFFSDLHLTKEKITNHILSDLTFHGFEALVCLLVILDNRVPLTELLATDSHLELLQIVYLLYPVVIHSLKHG